MDFFDRVLFKAKSYCKREAPKPRDFEGGYQFVLSVNLF